MKIRVKIRKGEFSLEKKLQKEMTEEYETWKQEILEKARGIKDLKELRKLMYSLGEDFEWTESTGRWLTEAKPYEIICVNIRVPGLEPQTERFTLYGILAFSKAMIKSYDHLGDLERVILEKRSVKSKEHFYAWSEVGHGYTEKWPEYFPDVHSLEEFYNRVHVVFERGDHSLVLEYPNPTYVILHKWFKNRFRIPHILKTIRDNFVNRSVGVEFSELEVSVITHEDLEKKLEIDWNGYAEKIIALDHLIHQEYRKLSLVQKIKNIFRKKNDPYYYLDCLYRVIWNIAPKNQERYLRGIRNRLKKAYEQEWIDTDFCDPITAVLNKVSELIDQTEFIQWQSFMDPKRYSKKIGIRKITGLSDAAIEAVATGLGKILYKSLDDIAYPEQWPQRSKMKLVLFVSAGHVYRLLRSITILLQKKFTFLALRLDGASKKFERIMTLRRVPLLSRLLPKPEQDEKKFISEEHQTEKFRAPEEESG